MKKGKRNRAKGSLAKQLKRDYLKRELKYGRLTMANNMQNWKEILTKICNRTLEQELLTCCHQFERTIDYKDLEISLLMDWIEDDLERRRMSFSYHTNIIDYIIDYFRKAYKSIYDELASQVNEMVNEWTNNSNRISFRSEENEKYIETMRYQMDEIRRVAEYENEARMFSVIDEYKSSSESLVNRLKALMHHKIEKLYKNIVRFTKEYSKESKKKESARDLLAAQHEILEVEIKTNWQKLSTKKNLIQRLIEKFEQISEVEDKKLNDLKMERNKLNECFLILRTKLIHDQNNDLSKRCLLVSNYNDIFQELQATSRMGTLMIKCLKSCRKYESTHEKLLPYPVAKEYFYNKIDENVEESGFFWNKIAGINKSRNIRNMPKKSKKGRANAKRIKINQFERELKYGQITLHRARKEWENLCKRITIPKLREDVICTWNSFEKIIDTKDFIISIYMDEVRSQEEAYMLTFRNHQDNINRMLEMYFTSVYGIHEENNQKLKIMIQESLQCLTNQADAAEITESYLNLVGFGMEKQRKRNEKQMKADNFGVMNEISTKHNHDVSNLTSIIEYKLEKMWNKMEKVRDDYSHYLKKNKNNYDAIKNSDEMNSSTVQKELKKLIGLQELFKRLTVKSNSLEAFLGQKIMLLESEKQSLKEYFLAFKNKLQKDRELDLLKRTLITAEFAEAFDFLNEILREGEKMLRMLQLCRRYERTDEKVLPYPLEGKIEETSSKIPSFVLFWQRMAEVETKRFALNEERNFLKLENKKLRQKIHNHCQCFYCPILPPIPTRAGRIPHTDGKSMVRKYDTQNRSK